MAENPENPPTTVAAGQETGDTVATDVEKRKGCCSGFVQKMKNMTKKGEKKHDGAECADPAACPAESGGGAGTNGAATQGNGGIAEEPVV